ncbi:hypothetical protein G1K97_00635 [Tenacibaculum finnmarkense]|uniref:hypothetical protein n=1 Tax=Tenacibaculum finnmarkense TaxID=2781243 RepID=UPI001EFC2733|nr:hypothetical protein [Tenacibaculum finnmarkense]MCG8892228.1 hypothetical protein [Tenacibaculum finnmarkense]MCG8900363.1 hypothetical protein [Tenacibaculum finnmarkense]
MKTYRIKKPFSKKKIALAYAISVIISLLMPFIPIYKHLGWGRLVLFNKEFFELYNPFLVVSCIILFFHVFLPFVGVFFVSIFADKTEVYFEEDTIVIFDKNKKELTTINHNQIIDIISDASVEIFYDNTSIKLKSTIWTRSNDFAEVLRNLNEIKSSKIIKHNENQEVFKGKAIIFTNLLYFRNYYCCFYLYFVP